MKSADTPVFPKFAQIITRKALLTQTGTAGVHVWNTKQSLSH